MRRIILTLIALSVLISGLFAQAKPKRTYVVGFYNLENLFDTRHDKGKNDYEYLPEGKNQWTDVKYNKKLHNMAKVIKAMAKDNGRYHTILGVSEVENRRVLEDLVNCEEIRDANYQIVHYDGPDRRGVDVALFYKPEQFTFIESESIPFTFEGSQVKFTMNKEAQDNFRTRDILMVRGTINGEMFAFFVAHLPSRIGGKGQDLRCRGAEIIRKRSIEIEKEFPGIKIVVMGDMNDNPTDDSMTKFIGAKEKQEEVGEYEFFSPFISMFKAGYGSLAYQGAWNIFDIILVNKALFKNKGGLTIQKINKKGYYARIYNAAFITNQKGPYKNTPFRTFAGGTFMNGYSDHYPTYIVLAK